MVDESAAVEVNDGWQIGAGGGGVSGGEDAEPEMARGIDGDVVGFDVVDGFGVWGRLEVEEVEEAAVEGAIAAASGGDDGGK